MCSEGRTKMVMTNDGGDDSDGDNSGDDKEAREKTQETMRLL